MIKKYMDLVPRYLLYNKKRTALTALSIILSIFLLTSVGIIINSYNMSMVEAAGKFNGTYHGMYRNIEADNINKLKDNPMLSQLGTYLEIGNSKIDRFTLLIAGSDKVAAELQNGRIIKGKFPENANEIAIEEWIYNKLLDRPQIGEKIALEYIRTKKNSTKPDIKEIHEFILCGILENTMGSRSSETGKAYTTLSTAENIIPKLDRLYKQFFRVKDSLPLEASLEKIKALGLVKKANENYLGDFKTNDDYFTVLKRAANAKYLITFVDGIVAIVIIMIIYNIFNIAVAERIRHFGLLKAIGITPKQIKKMLFGEALILAIIFVPVGILLGVWGTKALLVIAAMSNSVGNSGNFLLNPKEYVGTINILLPLFMGFVSILCAVYGPARTSSRISPIESLNLENKILKKQNNVNGKTGKRVKFLLGYSSKMAFENLKRNRRRFLATVISISVSIALFLAVNYLIGSLDPLGMTSQRVGADYVLALDGYWENQGYSDEAISEISKIPGIKGINKLKYAYIDLMLNPDQVSESYKKKYKELAKTSAFAARTIRQGIYDIPAFIYGVSDEQINQLSQTSKVNIDNDQDIIGAYMVQNLRYANATDLKKSDFINVDHSYLSNGANKKTNVRFEIANIFEELPIKNGVDFSAALITREKYLEQYLDWKGYQKIEINIDENADYIAIESELEDIASAQKGGVLKSFREDLEVFRNIQLQLGIILYSLIGVIVLVGLANIINSMSMNIILRRKEFGMLRALGMTKRQLRHTILTEGFYYGLISSIAGSIIGVLLIYWLYYIGRRILPIELNINTIGIGLTFITTILFSMGATLFPLKKANSLNIVESIQSVE